MMVIPKQSNDGREVTRPITPMDEAVARYDDAMADLCTALLALRERLEGGGVLTPEATQEKVGKAEAPIPATARLVEQVWVRTNNVSYLTNGVRSLIERLAV
jgi:hypothetical protein